MRKNNNICPLTHIDLSTVDKSMITRDHVIPNCFLSKGWDKDQPWIINTIKSANNGMSSNEQQVSQVVLMNGAPNTNKNYSKYNNLLEKAISVRKSNKRLFNEIINGPVVVTETGRFFKKLNYTVPNANQLVIDKMIKCINCYLFDELIPLDWKVKLLVEHPIFEKEFENYLIKVGVDHSEIYKNGEAIIFITHLKKHKIQLWTIVFHGCYTFISIVGPGEIIDRFLNDKKKKITSKLLNSTSLSSRY